MRSSGYVIIEGNIGVGKSRFSNALADALRAKGCEAHTLPEPDETNNPFLTPYYSEPNRWAYTMQTHLLGKRYEATQYAQHGALAGRGWFVMDRSYFGDIYFANVCHAYGYMDENEYASYLTLHHAMQSAIHYPTACVFLHASPEVCRGRISKRMSEKVGRLCEAGIQLNYLHDLDAGIHELEDFLTRQTSVISFDYSADRDEAQIAACARMVAARLVEPTGEARSCYFPWGETAAGLIKQ